MRRILVLTLLLVGVLAPPASSADPPAGTLTASVLGNDLVRLADGRNGSLLVSSRDGIARLGPDGIVAVAGAGPCPQRSWCAPDGPVATTRISPLAIAADPTGAVVYFAEQSSAMSGRIRKVEGGRVTTVVNDSGAPCVPYGSGCGDGGPATAASLSGAQALGVGPDGSLYISDAHRIRRVAPDGAISTFAGADHCAGEDISQNRPCGDGGPAAAAALNLEGGIAVPAQGRVAAIDQDRVRIIGTDGIIRTVAGNGTRCGVPDPCGDGGPGSAARFGMAITATFHPNGDLFVGERGNGRIRRVSPDGRVETVAGTYAQCGFSRPCGGVGGPSQRANLGSVESLAVAGGDLFAISADRDSRLVRVRDVAGITIEPKQRYRFVAGDGGVFNFGWAPFFGSTGDRRLNQPIVAGAAPGAGGYWMVARDGGIFSFGKARFHGSAVGRATSPVVGMAADTRGRGYWVLEQSGRVHAFGIIDHGSGAPGSRNRAVGIATDPDGDGYWIAFDDGTVQANGAAVMTTGPRPRGPIVGITGRVGGYWLAGADGAVYAYGSARSFGSMAGRRLNRPIVAIVATPTRNGYWLVASDGGVFSFGDARFHGSTGHLRLNRPIVGVIAG